MTGATFAEDLPTGDEAVARALPPSRLEWFDSVPSTNDIARLWLREGTPEWCLAVAREQTAGRGRQGRTWVAPVDAGLLLSIGFRPAWISVDCVWQLSATVSLAMATAAEDVAALARGTVGLKWPNDLVVERGDGLRKVGGVLGEAEGLGSDDPRLVVGIGVNADWDPTEFPAAIAPTMTSLRELRGAAVDAGPLLDRFVAVLGSRLGALRQGRFEQAEWESRQVTTGREVRVDLGIAESTVDETVDAIASGVDPMTGGLVLVDRRQRTGERVVHAGEVVHVRLANGGV